VVQKFMELEERSIAGQCLPYQDLQVFLTEGSGEVAAQVDLDALLTLAIYMPVVGAQTSAASEASATVRSSQTPRHMDWRLVKEDGKWKIDLLATLKALPPELRPDLSEFEKPSEPRRSLSNIKQLGLGLAMYATDYDGRLPFADRWMDTLTPYVRNERIFHAPSAPEGDYGGYAFNARLSWMNWDEVWAPDKVVAAFETPWTWKNAAGGPAGMPKVPLYGSEGGAVLFADGHAKLVLPGEPLVWDPKDPRYKPTKPVRHSPTVSPAAGSPPLESGAGEE
jgi:prepilin-type processing-associated H-X9-DG protein